MPKESLKPKRVWPTKEENIHGIMAVAMLDLDYKVTYLKDKIESCPVPDPQYLEACVYAKRLLEHEVHDSFLTLKDSLLQAVKKENPSWTIHIDLVPPVDGWDPYKKLFEKLHIEAQPTPMPGRYLLLPICKTEYQITKED